MTYTYDYYLWLLRPVIIVIIILLDVNRIIFILNIKSFLWKVLQLNYWLIMCCTSIFKTKFNYIDASFFVIGRSVVITSLSLNSVDIRLNLHFVLIHSWSTRVTMVYVKTFLSNVIQYNMKWRHSRELGFFLYVPFYQRVILNYFFIKSYSQLKKYFTLILYRIINFVAFASALEKKIKVLMAILVISDWGFSL